jgi:hypothetical protein
MQWRLLIVNPFAIREAKRFITSKIPGGKLTNIIPNICFIHPIGRESLLCYQKWGINAKLIKHPGLFFPFFRGKNNHLIMFSKSWNVFQVTADVFFYSKQSYFGKFQPL